MKTILFGMFKIWLAFAALSALASADGLTTLDSETESISIITYASSAVTSAMVSSANPELIFNSNKAGSLTSMVRFADNARQRMNLAVKQGENIPTIVTLKSPTNEAQVLELAVQYSMKINYVKFVSTEGGGTAPWPADNSLLSTWEGDLASKTGAGFKLVIGYTTLFALLNEEMLKPLEKDDRVLLVDIGPIELAEKYPNAKIYPKSTNIYYDYALQSKGISQTDATKPQVTFATQLETSYANTHEKLQVDYSVLDDRDLYANLNYSSTVSNCNRQSSSFQPCPLDSTRLSSRRRMTQATRPMQVPNSVHLLVDLKGPAESYSGQVP